LLSKTFIYSLSDDNIEGGQEELNKQRDLLSKTLVVGVIVLFIGVGIQPAFAVTSDTPDNNDDCKLCPKVSKSHLILIRSLLNRLEKYDNQQSELSKVNPEFEKKYQEISNKIKNLKDINSSINTKWDFPIICSILGIIALSFGTIAYIIDLFLQQNPPAFLYLIFELLFYLFDGFFVIIGAIFLLGCTDFPYLKSIIGDKI
jgi:hypothetical protein